MLKLSKIEREFLVQAVRNQSLRINGEGKRLVVELCERFGVEFKPTLCQQCYHDAAFLVLAAERKLNGNNTKRTIIVKDGVDVFFNGRRVNPILVTTDKECRELMAQGMNADYFEKVENADNAED